MDRQENIQINTPSPAATTEAYYGEAGLGLCVEYQC
jgi:hypothetical protein